MSVESPWAFVRSLVVPSTGPQNVAHYECRSCGASLSGVDDDCPYCEESDIVRYELD
jgi:rubrerythrin